MIPRVYNKSGYDYPPSGTYIGRPTKWGNPFRVGREGDRQHVVALYRKWITSSGLDVSELRGKDLVCWCAPLACHGDVLLEIANSVDGPA